MKYLKPEMSVLILEAEHVIRTSTTVENDASDSDEVTAPVGDGTTGW